MKLCNFKIIPKSIRAIDDTIFYNYCHLLSISLHVYLVSKVNVSFSKWYKDFQDCWGVIKRVKKKERCMYNAPEELI